MLEIASFEESFHVEGLRKRTTETAVGAVVMFLILLSVPNWNLGESERERKFVESENLKAKQQFELFLENLDEAIYILDPHSMTILYTNPVYEKIWRRPIEALYSNPYAHVDAIVPEDYKRCLQQFPERLSHRHDAEFRIKWPDGQIRWILNSSIPVYEHGQIKMIYGITRDITNEKEIEKTDTYQLHCTSGTC